MDYLKNYHKNKTESNEVIILCKILAKIGNVPGYGFIIFISYNFFNIYRTGFLLFNLLLCSCLVGILKMFYANPRPYFESLEILSVSEEGGWGNPSGHSLTAVSFILSFWKISFQMKNLKEKENFKKFCLYASLLLIFSILISRLLIGAHSLNQIIFGGLIGLALFYFYFYIIELDTENHEQLLFLVKLEENKFFKAIVIFLVNLLLIIISLIFYFINRNTENEIKYLNILFDRFVDTNVIQSYKMLQNEGMYSFATSFGNLSLFFGIFLELNITFKNKVKHWASYNFDFSGKSFPHQQLNIKMFKWNNINPSNRIKKTFIFLILLSLVYFPLMLLGSISNNLFFVIIFKLFIPVNLIILGMFFYFKDVFRYFKAINHHNDNNEFTNDEKTEWDYKEII